MLSRMRYSTLPNMLAAGTLYGIGGHFFC